MRTIVSWTRFCEWVQGKKVAAEYDNSTHTGTVLEFEDGTTAALFSDFDTKFGEKVPRPPVVECTEKSP